SRLAEAKGAVELLLGQAYARRDHVALVSYRGTDAEVLLAPTRSLVQTKRRLAAIPGGGATPLATGLSRAVEIAHTATQKGLAPTIVLLADGRANIALNGDADRTQANMDAQTLAARIAAAGIEALVIDTTIRPEKTLQHLAQTMNATYIPLPRADARRVSSAISKSLAE
ncbi:MAG: VWA domain-containing protein, partial [Paracoccaceae bacterium]